MSRSRTRSASAKGLKCPKCRSDGFVPSPETPAPTLVYRTDQFDTCVKRYRLCTVCAHKWVTSEEFERAVGAAAPEA